MTSLEYAQSLGVFIINYVSSDWCSKILAAMVDSQQELLPNKLYLLGLGMRLPWPSWAMWEFYPPPPTHLVPPTELHRTQTDYDDAFITKMYLFQCVNFYTSLFYIAYLKGKWVSRQGLYPWPPVSCTILPCPASPTLRESSRHVAYFARESSA